VTAWVYCLVDPRTKGIRYVGSSADPYERLRDHISAGSDSRGKPTVSWVKELKAAGLRPEVVVIAERPTRGAAVVLENETIARFRAEGHDLLNGGVGGGKGLSRLSAKSLAESPEKTRDEILAAVKANRGDLKSAAVALGVSWRTIYRRIQFLSLQPEIDALREEADLCPNCKRPLDGVKLKKRKTVRRGPTQRGTT
jgi:hypothetical protein